MSTPQQVRGTGVTAAEALLVVASEPEKGYDSTGALDALLPAAVLVDLVDAGLLVVDDGTVGPAPSADGSTPGASYLRAVLALGPRLTGTVAEVLWALTDGLRPLAATVGIDLVAEGRLEPVRNRVLKMDFGVRFPTRDTAYREDVVRSVREAYEQGTTTGPWGRAALLLALSGHGPAVLPGVATDAMDAEVRDGSSLVGTDDLAGASLGPVLGSLAATIQQTLR